ncbi:MAG: hypothetical protein ACUVRD_08630 [Bacteroidia bacterium]
MQPLTGIIRSSSLAIFLWAQRPLPNAFVFKADLLSPVAHEWRLSFEHRISQKAPPEKAHVFRPKTENLTLFLQTSYWRRSRESIGILRVGARYYFFRRITPEGPWIGLGWGNAMAPYQTGASLQAGYQFFLGQSYAITLEPYLLVELWSGREPPPLFALGLHVGFASRKKRNMSK